MNAAALALADQILAVLHQGEATTEEVAARVGLVVCACDICEARPVSWRWRPAVVDDVYPLLHVMMNRGLITGEIEKVAGGYLDGMPSTVRWKRRVLPRTSADT